MRRFRIVSVLAKGGMGVTYRAWDELSGVPVVVKIPKKSLCEEPGFLERFDREVRISASLSHPHIVPVIDFGVEDGEPFLAMRFLPGGSLASRIPRDNGGTPLPAAASLLHLFLPAIASALDHAHASGILHRDVKPANIFLDALGSAFLGDFGLVKLIGDEEGPSEATLTATNIAMGTQFYMAPERFVPRATVDGRSDQYSLAVTAYELLAGKRPFIGQTAHIVVEHATLPPPPLSELRPELPTTLCAAIEKALAKKPAERFESCVAFAQEALRDVPKPPYDPGFARLLCPSCSHLLRLPVTAGGRQGRCPRCKQTMTIAPDLGSLWLASEHATEPSEEEARSEILIKEEDGSTPAPSRSKIPLIAATMATATFVAILAGFWWEQRNDPAEEPGAAVVQTENTEPPLSENLPLDQVAERLVAPEQENTPEAPQSTDSTAIVTHAPIKQELGPEPVVAKPPQNVSAVTPSASPAPDAASATAAIEPDARGDSPPTAGPSEQSGYFDKEVKWVLIGDPGNSADTLTTLGAVAHEFMLAQYELTNEQYCRFLNGSDAGRHNLHGVADGPTSEGNPASGIDAQKQADNTYRYQPKPNMTDRPAVGVRWCDAARLANWLHNGATLAADGTESGAYSLDHRDLSPQEAIPKQDNARFWVPSLDEWFKAAYYKAGKTSASYWKYPTATNADVVPTANSGADGNSGLRGIETAANFNKKAVRDEPLHAEGVANVGTNGAASGWGAFDMGGNAAELVSFSAAEPKMGKSPRAIACGGDCSAPRSTLDRAWFKNLDQEQASPAAELKIGIRLARTTQIAEGVFSADEVPRQLKSPSFAVVKGLQSVFPAGAVKTVILNDCLPVDIQKLKARLQQIQRLDTGTLDSEVSRVFLEIATDTDEVLGILQARHLQLNQLLPAGGPKQPPQDLFQFLDRFADDLQKRLVYDEIVGTSSDKLAPL